MKRYITVLIILFICGAFSSPASARSSVVQRINTNIAIVHHQQAVIGIKRTQVSGKYMVAKSHSYKVWVLKQWRKRMGNVNHLFRNPPQYSAWLCIHRGEAAWNAHTGNGYYGGLQMDLSFQRSYGRHLLGEKGTADHWSEWEQIWVAERAYKSGRGFYPWPNTARACGLI